MNNLKKLRKEHNLLQKDLSGILNVAQNTYSGWENEKFEIDNINLFKLADFFEVSIDYLLGRDFTFNRKSTIQEIYDQLNNQEKELILIYAKGILDAKNTHINSLPQKI